MNKLFFMALIYIAVSGCSNNAKTEQEEQRKRDSMDNVVIDQNQRFVDSLEKAEEAKDSLKAHGKQ
jgi:hypothetical protein